MTKMFQLIETVDGVKSLIATGTWNEMVTAWNIRINDAEDAGHAGPKLEIKPCETC